MLHPYFVNKLIEKCTESTVYLSYRLEFIAFDDHSGLKEIEWRLYDAQNNSILHAEGEIAVITPTVRQNSSYSYVKPFFSN